MSKPTGISRAKLSLTALAIPLPIVSIVHYEDVLEGLIVGGPPALLLGLFIFAVKFRYLLLVLYLLAAVAWLMPSHQPPYLARRRMACDSRLNAIGMALGSYYDNFGTYPPPYSTDADGNPNKSWRELILPYVERRAEPHALFDCPRLRPRKYPFQGYEPTSIAPKTAYVAIVGDHAAWPKCGGRKKKDFIDGLGKTILVVEIKGSTINWNEPRDVSLDHVISGFGATGPDTVGSPHLFANALFADGKVLPILTDFPAADFRRIVTIDDGEKFSDDLHSYSDDYDF